MNASCGIMFSSTTGPPPAKNRNAGRGRGKRNGGLVTRSRCDAPPARRPLLLANRGIGMLAARRRVTVRSGGVEGIFKLELPFLAGISLLDRINWLLTRLVRDAGVAGFGSFDTKSDRCVGPPCSHPIGNLRLRYYLQVYPSLYRSIVVKLQKISLQNNCSLYSAVL